MRINKEMSMRYIVTIIGLNMVVIFSTFVVGGCNNENASKSQNENALCTKFNKFAGLEFGKPTPNSWKYPEGRSGLNTYSVDLKLEDIPQQDRDNISQLGNFIAASARVYSEEHILDELCIYFGRLRDYEGNVHGFDEWLYENSSTYKLECRKQMEEVAAKFEKLCDLKFNYIEKEGAIFGGCYWAYGSPDEGVAIRMSQVSDSSRNFEKIMCIEVSVWNHRQYNFAKDMKEQEDRKALGLIPSISKHERVRYLEGVFNYKFGECINGGDRSDGGVIRKIIELNTPFSNFNKIALLGDPEDGSLFSIVAAVHGDTNLFEDEMSFMKSVFGEPKSRYEYGSDHVEWEIEGVSGDTINAKLFKRQENVCLVVSSKINSERTEKRIAMLPDATFGIIPASKKGSLASEVEGAMGFRFGCDVRNYDYKTMSDSIVAELSAVGLDAKTTLAGFDKIQLFGSKISGECYKIRVAYKFDAEMDTIVKSLKMRNKIDELNYRILESIGVSMTVMGEDNPEIVNYYIGGNSSVMLRTSRDGIKNDEDCFVYLDFIDKSRWNKERQ